MKEIPISGVWLMRRGGENDPKAAVEVYVEVEGQWRHVITESLNSNFSHCVSAFGIEGSPLADWINLTDAIPATTEILET